MNQEEIKLIHSAPADQAFYVLQTTVEADSLFLRKKCEDVDAKSIATDENVQYFIQRMKATLEEQQGVGLASPQVGIGRNIFLFVRIDKPGFPVEVAINPRIVNYPDETICFEGDGCLSIPNTTGNSIRYPWIDVEYYNEHGVLIKEKLSGYSRENDFTAIIFQHEYDHLQGVLFIDKLCDESQDLSQNEE